MIRIYTLVTLILCLFVSVEVSNAQKLERTLIGVSGTSTKTPTVQLNYSIGELANNTLKGTGPTTVICTEGFQQKENKDVAAFNPREQWYDMIRVDAYPNPFTDNLTIYVYDNNFDRYRVEITDESERVVGRYDLQQNKLIVSLKQLPAGFYWLRFYNSNNTKHYKPFKLIKMN